MYRRRRDGRWVASIDVRGRKVVAYAVNKTEAVAKLKQLRTTYDGRAITNETVAAYLTRWLAANERYWKPSAYQFNEKYVRVHLVPALGQKKLAKLTGSDIEAMLRGKHGTMSATSVGHIYTVLHNALNYAENLDILIRNPMRGLRKPRTSGVTFQTFTRDEARRLIEAVKGDRMEALYLVAINTGMRQGELLALRWRDVRLDAGMLAVRQSKTRAGVRGVVLTPLAVEALTAHRERQNVERQAGGWTGDLVFPDEAGQPYSANRLRKSWKRLITRAGLPNIRFHDLRHSTATLLLEAGVNAKLVQELLGHSRVNVTLDTYSHVTPILHTSVANTMQGILGDETAPDSPRGGRDP